MSKDMGASGKPDRAVVNGAGQAVSALRASVPSAEFQSGWYAAIRAAEAIALKWRDENREAAAKARTRDARATRLGFENANLHEQLEGAAIECNAIAAAIRELPCVAPPRAEPLRHAYRPHRKWSWFCADCGYPEHETLKHLPAQGTEAGTAETEGLGPKDDGPVRDSECAQTSDARSNQGDQ